MRPVDWRGLLKRGNQFIRQAGLFECGLVFQFGQAIVDVDQVAVKRQIAIYPILLVALQGGRPDTLLFVIESLDAYNLACASEGAPLATGLLRQRLLIEKMMQVHPEAAMKIKNILIGLHTRFDLLRPSIDFNGGSGLSWSLRRVSADRHQRA